MQGKSILLKSCNMSKEAGDDIQVYKVMRSTEHALLRPDMYIGNVNPQECEVELFEEHVTLTDSEATTPECADQGSGTFKGLEPKRCKLKPKPRIVKETIAHSHAILKLCDELITNAIDECKRDPACNEIRVDVNATGKITVYNNGRGIPIRKQEVCHDGRTEELYVPQIIFGLMNSGSNFEDREQRETAGRNGLGAKLANIYSSTFTVETAFAETKQTCEIVWSSNMSTCSPPKVRKSSLKGGFVRVSFVPDFPRFGFAGPESPIWKGTCRLIEKRAYEAALVTLGRARVKYNGSLVEIKSCRDFAAMYVGCDAKQLVSWPSNSFLNSAATEGATWQVVVGSHSEAKQVSFVNGVATTQGGTHVDFARAQIIDRIVDACQGRRGGPPQARFLRERLFLFVNATVVNPAFESQTKTKLATRASTGRFRQMLDVSDDFIKKLVNSDLVTAAIDAANQHDKKALNAQDAKANRGSQRPRVAKLDDANRAGTKDAHKCQLLVTEGDSAKATCVAGLGAMGKTGRDFFGVFPLKGKILNTRTASARQIMENKELADLKRTLGLESNRTYADKSGLRYGKICIATDADVDGSHIKGLVLNFFESQWPELIDMGMVSTLVTPVIRARRGAGPQAIERKFYAQQEFEEWCQTAEGRMRDWKIKYYKGLGTSSSQEAREVFGSYEENTVEFTDCQSGGSAALRMAFDKARAEDRKRWIEAAIVDKARSSLGGPPSVGLRLVNLRNANGGGQPRPGTASMTVQNFVNDELVQFSIADNVRSIPNIMDGLKPAQRKILYTCLLKSCFKGKKEMKVAQLAGAVSEHAAYHHGEVSLHSAIIGMAQGFMGSNQVPLLHPEGQFGSRLQGGKEAAAPRYISTCLSPLSQALFPAEDCKILEYLVDDGDVVEPRYYTPALPLLLFNGAEGIGTGWSTSIPPFAEDDIMENLRRLCSIQPIKSGSENSNINSGFAEPELVPMNVGFWGFQGTSRRIGAHKWELSGVCEVAANRRSVRITELPPREWTSSYKAWLEEQEWIRDTQNYTSETTVDFHVALREPLKHDEDVMDKFRLRKTFSASNMHAFDAGGRIRRYDSAEELLREWYAVRIEWYEKRRAHVIEQLELALRLASNKRRFIQEVLDKELELGRPEGETCAQLATTGYGAIDGGFSYLFDMNMRAFTQERIKQLDAELDQTTEAKIKTAAMTKEDFFRAGIDRAQAALATHHKLLLCKDNMRSDTPDPAAKKRPIKRKAGGPNTAP